MEEERTVAGMLRFKQVQDCKSRKVMGNERETTEFKVFLSMLWRIAATTMCK